MHDKHYAGAIADIVEIIEQSNRTTILDIADEILENRWHQNIVRIKKNPKELPSILKSKEGYSIGLSSEKRQRLSQICVLILVVFEGIDLNEYDKINSFEELFERSHLFEEYFNKIIDAFTAKKISIS